MHWNIRDSPLVANFSNNWQKFKVMDGQAFLNMEGCVLFGY